MAELSKTFKLNGGGDSTPTTSNNSNKLSDTFKLNSSTTSNVLSTIPLKTVPTVSRRDSGYKGTNQNEYISNRVNEMLSDGYKISKDDMDEVKAYYKRYSASANVGNNANAQRKYLESLSDSDRKLAMDVDKLYNKSSNIGSFFGGFINAIPGYTKTTDKALDYLGVDDDYKMASQIKAQKEQNPIASTAGAMASKMAQYGLAKQIPVINKVSTGIGKSLGGSKVAEAIGNIGADTLVDLALDTTPELVGNIQNGKSAKETTIDALKNIGGNVGFNVVGELLGNSKEIAKYVKNKNALKKANKIIDSTDDAIKSVDDVVKTSNDTVKAVNSVTDATDDAVKETLKPLTNKEIENILNNPTAKAEFESANGIKLEGTKAEQRKQIKSLYDNASDIAVKKPTVVGNTDENTSTIKSTLKEQNGLNRSISPKDDWEINEDIGISKSPKYELSDDGSYELVSKIDDSFFKPFSDENLDDLNPEDIGISKVYSNTLRQNGLADMTKETDVAASKYAVSHEAVSMADAKKMIDKEGVDKLTEQFIEGSRTIESPKDVDATMMLLISKQEQLAKATDDIDKLNLKVEIDCLKRELRKAGTKGGQVIEAFRKWAGTADGAVNQGDSILDKETVKWKKKNVKKSQELDEVADKINKAVKQKSNSKLDSALRDMGDKNGKNRIDTLRTKADGTPKTHEEIVAEVKASFEKELGSIEGKITDNDIEFAASMVENNVPKSSIIDELENRLKNGEWYTLDESLPEKVEIDGQIKSALNNMFKEETVAEEVKLTREEVRKRIAETLKSESASMDFNDADIDYLTSLKMSGASSSEIADALKCRVANGTWGVSETTVEEVNNLFKQAELYDINSKERVECENKAFALIADDIFKEPGTLWEKFDSWRYLAMLGNTKTHGRNIVSNAIFNVETSISNTIATGLEKIASKFSKNVDKTKALINPVTDANLLKATLNDANEGAFRQLSGNKYSTSGIRRQIQNERKVFKSKALNFLSEGNSKALEVEDAIFTHGKYSTSLAGYLKANGVDESIFDAERKLLQLEDNLQKLKSTDMYLMSAAEKSNLAKEIKNVETGIDSLKESVGLLNKGREYAIKQAEYATFHEDSALASAMSKFMRNARESDKTSTKVAGKLLEGLIPFTKTPINVLKSGVEYSPLNAIKNAFEVFDVKNGSKSATEFIESLSKTLTGTGVYALGYWMYERGALTAGYDSVKGKFDSNRGLQSYALKIGDKTYTIDSFAPPCMPLLMGAEQAKADEDKGTSTFDAILSGDFDKILDGISINDMLNRATAIANPVFETSMLNNVQNTISAVQNSNQGTGNGLIDAGASALSGYFTQGVPTVLGQVARTIDNTRRSTYTDKTGAAGQIDKAFNKVVNKIPGLSQTNEAYVDLWGKEQKNSEGNILQRAAYQMLSPSYSATVSNDPVDKEISRLYDKSKESKVLPSSYSKKVGGTQLTEKQYHDYSVTVGNTRHDILNSLIKSDIYKNANDEGKADLISNVYSLANKVGKYSITKDDSAETSKVYKAYKELGIDGYIEYLTIKDIDLNGDGKTKKKDDILPYLQQNYSKEKQNEWIDFLGYKR